MNLKPLSDRVLVRRVDSDTVTQGGIVIPDSAAEKADQGTVVAVGSGRRMENGTLVALTVKAGDRVLFGKNVGQSVKVKSDEFLVLKEDDILGIIQ